jgi:hypothetical protein
MAAMRMPFKCWAAPSSVGAGIVDQSGVPMLPVIVSPSQVAEVHSIENSPLSIGYF